MAEIVTALLTSRNKMIMIGALCMKVGSGELECRGQVDVCYGDYCVLGTV